jgi:hypothetical protein
MMTILNTPFGYFVYNLDILWNGLYQMGNESDEAS